MLTVLWLYWRCFNRVAVAAKEYVKVECYVSVLKEARDRDFGTRYVISRSQIHILFLAARSRKNFEVTARHLQKCKPPFPLALAKEKSVTRFVKLLKTSTQFPSCAKNFLVSRISSFGRALDCRAGGRGFDTRDQTDTQGVKNNWEIKVLPLPRKWLDLRVARMTT